MTSPRCSTPSPTRYLGVARLGIDGRAVLEIYTERSRIMGPRGHYQKRPRSRLLLVLLLLELMFDAVAESPWGLPLVEDHPASLAKVLMEELASLKSDNRSWPGGTHSLHYHYLSLLEPGPRLPQFLAVGYVDDQPFIQFDSQEDKARPQAPWMEAVGSQYWETETQKQWTWVRLQQMEMLRVMSYYNQSTGTHSTQRMFGCEIHDDGSFTSFWHFGYDGQDHLTLDLETLSWVSAQPVALQTKRWWEMERCYAEYNKAYLESLCLHSLHRYLELGGPTLTRIEAPTVKVTRKVAQDRRTRLKCWALGFYPRDISLSWWLGEEALVQDTEYVETRPSGDGTYQTWAALDVPEGKESSYSCLVEHSGLNDTLTVGWEPSFPNVHMNRMYFSSLVVTLVVIGILGLVIWYFQGGGIVTLKSKRDQSICRSSDDHPSRTPKVFSEYLGTGGPPHLANCCDPTAKGLLN